MAESQPTIGTVYILSLEKVKFATPSHAHVHAQPMYS